MASGRAAKSPCEKVNLRSDVNIADAAASFQAAAVEMLIAPTLRAAESYGATAIWLAGGVSANKYLRQQLSARTNLPVYAPPLPLCTDNAAMIAAAGYFRYAAGQRDSLALDVLPMLPLVSA
jgi:N6-L-threonylcarbamoyladenine synthase